MQQIRVGKLNLVKCKSIETYLLLIWLITPFVLTVARFILVRVNVFGTANTCIQWALAFVPIVFFLAVIRDIPQKKYRFFLFVFALSALTFALTALTNSRIGYFFTRESYGIERVFRPDSAIFALLFFGLVADSEDLLEATKKFAYIDFICLLVFDFLPACLQGGWEDISYSGATVLYKYNLSFGYAMALPVIVFIYQFFKEKKILSLVLGLIGMALIFTNGSRGALLLPVAFVCLMVISNIIDSRNISWKTVKISAVVIVLLAVLLFGEAVLNAVAAKLGNMGVQSRTLELLSNGKITSDSGRSEIWMAVVQAIKDGGLFGYGAFGDRPFVFPHHFVAYSHNIFLEMICSFGIIGVIICIILIAGSIIMIFRCKDTLTRELFIIFFSVSLQLGLSFSFWYVWEFWAAIAIAHNYFQQERDKLRKREALNDG